MQAPASASRPRDPRLDFFRGSAMFIIFIAHCRGNVLWNVIPARFGISDAADMFVFLSGMAASIAFGGTFLRLGPLIGTARIAYRCVQLYAAHIGLFIVGVTIIAEGTRLLGTDYASLLDLQRFYAHPGDALVGLFTLTYVPHYFDILPMYIALLAMVPLAMTLARVSPWIVIAASLTLWAATTHWDINLPANADDQPNWFFDPFAWQLIFFTGFALRRQWIIVPLDSPLLFWAAVAMLIFGLGITQPWIFEHVPVLERTMEWQHGFKDKTNYDILRYLHFLSEAYVVIVLLKGREQALLGPVLKPFHTCGQQALSVYVTCESLAHIGGMAFDRWGDGWAMQVVVNAVAFAGLFGVAYLARWAKRAPWKRPMAVAAPAPRPAPVIDTGPSLVPESGD